MKVSLYCAISLDGFIAAKNGDSNWVSRADIPYFEAEMKKAGCIIIGGRTFRQFEGDIYPVKGVVNIVLTHGPAGKFPPGTITAASPEEALEKAKKAGCEQVLLVGGGHLNGAFLNAGLIDEVTVDIHPLILGEGIKLFEKSGVSAHFEKLSEQVLEGGLVLVRYRVLKTA